MGRTGRRGHGYGVWCHLFQNAIAAAILLNVLNGSGVRRRIPLSCGAIAAANIKISGVGRRNQVIVQMSDGA
jgi:hypothetical protein